MTQTDLSASHGPLNEGLSRLAAFLQASVPQIVDAWRRAIHEDPLLNTGTSLPRAKLDDHIPSILESFARSFEALDDAVDRATETTSQSNDATAHGLQRWQQGYDLHEVTREWGCLHLCLVDAFEHFEAANAELAPGVMAQARRRLASLCSNGVSDSTAQYFRLSRLEAEGSVQDLEEALEQIRELERERGTLWHEAAHDLRGNLGAVANAAYVLSMDEAASRRDQFLSLLNRNVGALHRLLDDVTDLARLQAGREQRRLERIDVASLLRGLVADMQPMADAKGLSLTAHGAAELIVETDAVKVRRVVQNLLINALKYTRKGSVTVHWGDSEGNHDRLRWMVSVTDTGPGLHAGPGAPIAGAIEEATTVGREMAAKDAGDPVEPVAHLRAKAGGRGAAASRPAFQVTGEGLGLSIVKRLCELLDASIEIESSAGQGSTFRVVLPRRYAVAAASPNTGNGLAPLSSPGV